MRTVEIVKHIRVGPTTSVTVKVTGLKDKKIDISLAMDLLNPKCLEEEIYKYLESVMEKDEEVITKFTTESL